MDGNGGIGTFVTIPEYTCSLTADQGHPRPNVSKYARVSDGFLCALEACLVNLEFS